MLVVALGCAIGCKSSSPAPPEVPTPSAPPVVEVDLLRSHIVFLADDAQEGRLPGTEADARVQAYIEQAFATSGLEPLFGDGYRQAFSLTDGVRVREGGGVDLTVGDVAVPHAILPFSGDTGEDGPVSAPLVYVGHGITRGGTDTGDYEGLGTKVKGAIVVALAGGPADDPHLTSADLRAQTKLISARDHGAVGFVLWDPRSDAGFPNHGEASDLKIPAVWVGSAGSRALLEAFAGKKKVPADVNDPVAFGLRVGTRSKPRATLRTDVEPVEVATANVAGKVVSDGTTDRVVVIGAHMDHLGMGTQHSLSPGERAVHNGADDNASGVAAMLEVCHALASSPTPPPYEIWCVAFGAEEMGLVGSKHFVETMSEAERRRILAMLNFDMVGRLGPDGLVVAGAGTSSIWPELIDAHRGGLRVRTSEDGYGPSDHGSFYEQKIPVLHFFTGPHEDYHKPSDDIEKINFEGAATVANFALDITRAMLARRLEPDYVQTERPAQRGGGFRVSLGTMPDYAAKVDGVRLSGVRKGGPADKAGMRKGDVITRLGEREIHNLDDYMAAFAELQPGVTIRAVVRRDGQDVELELIPAAPRG